MIILATIGEYYLVFFILRFFSSMFPSMPKWEIVNMNANGIPLVNYPKLWRVLTCCIHDFVCHSCQHSSKYMKIDKVTDKDLTCIDSVLIVW